MDHFEDTVVSTRVRLARNSKDLPFPRKLSETDERIYSILMKGAQQAASKSGKFQFYLMHKLSEIERMSMFEKHLISLDLLNNVETGAVLINDSETISVMINEEDHIRAQGISRGLKLEETYKLIDTYDDALAKELNIAYHERYGFLTCCPTNLGTGMRASVMMFLPALTMTGSISSILNAAQKAGITTRGIYGEGSEAEGYMYQISNQITIGISEQEVLERVNNAVIKISEAELHARDRIYKAQQTDTKDKIMRAFGVMNYACVLKRSEFMSLISHLRLGVYYGLFNIPYKVLDDLIVESEQANLSLLTKRQLDVGEADIARAVLTKEKLKKYKEKGGKDE